MAKRFNGFSAGQDFTHGLDAEGRKTYPKWDEKVIGRDSRATLDLGQAQESFYITNHTSPITHYVTLVSSYVPYTSFSASQTSPTVA
jgi:hypothetical protein